MAELLDVGRTRTTVGVCLMKSNTIVSLIRVGIACGVIPWLVVGQVTSPVPIDSPSGLLKKGSFLNPADLPSHLVALHEGLGSRLATPEKAQLTLAGTLVDASGTRSAQLTIQAPGIFAFRDERGRSLFYNDTGFNIVAGIPASDDAVIESLLAHFPDSLILQAAGGGSFRRIGSHFRGNSQDGGPVPLWTVFAFSPNTRPGLTRGKALQQDLFIAVDERTGLPADIRVVTQVGATRHVIQTQFSGWTQQSGQRYPGRIVRLEDGQQKLRFDVTTSSVGPALPLTVFKP